VNTAPLTALQDPLVQLRDDELQRAEVVLEEALVQLRVELKGSLAERDTPTRTGAEQRLDDPGDNHDMPR